MRDGTLNCRICILEQVVMIQMRSPISIISYVVEELVNITWMPLSFREGYMPSTINWPSKSCIDKMQKCRSLVVLNYLE